MKNKGNSCIDKNNCIKNNFIRNNSSNNNEHRMKINNNNNNNIIELQLAYKVIEFISIFNNVQSSFNNKLYLNNQLNTKLLKII